MTDKLEANLMFYTGLILANCSTSAVGTITGIGFVLIGGLGIYLYRRELQ